MKLLRMLSNFLPREGSETLSERAVVVPLRLIAAVAVIVSTGCGMGSDSTEDSFVADSTEDSFVADSTEDSFVADGIPFDGEAFSDSSGAIVEDGLANNGEDDEVADDDIGMAGSDALSGLVTGVEGAEEAQPTTNAVEEAETTSAREASTAQRRIWFNDGFESSNWRRNYRIHFRNNIAHLRSGCVGRGRCLRIRVRRGRHYGVGIDYRFRRQPEHLYAEYHVMYENSMRHYTGKSPGFLGTYGRGGWGGKRSDGYNGWSARGAAYGRGYGVLNAYYVYHVGQRKHYGDVWDWRNSFMRYGKWAHVKQFMRLNTPGRKNGVLKAWVDGRMVFSRSDIMFRKTARLKIESYTINYYHGGSAVSPVDAYVRIDNLKFYN